MTNQRWLLLKSVALMWVARIALFALPFGLVRCLLERPSPKPSKRVVRHRDSPERLAWAIGACSAFVPRSTCLVKAIAGQWLLRHEGYATMVRIGVSKRADGGFLAHAWLEHDGKVLIGAAERARFVALPDLQAQTLTSGD